MAPEVRMQENRVGIMRALGRVLSVCMHAGFR